MLELEPTNDFDGSIESWEADALPNQDFKETLKWDILQLDKKMNSLNY